MDTSDAFEPGVPSGHHLDWIRRVRADKLLAEAEIRNTEEIKRREAFERVQSWRSPEAHGDGSDLDEPDTNSSSRESSRCPSPVDDPLTARPKATREGRDVEQAVDIKFIGDCGSQCVERASGDEDKCLDAKPQEENPPKRRVVNGIGETIRTQHTHIPAETKHTVTSRRLYRDPRRNTLDDMIQTIESLKLTDDPLTNHDTSLACAAKMKGKKKSCIGKLTASQRTLYAQACVASGLRCAR
ncbi:hypothetical protein FISHEDRAFT_71642 [Fistulina hepatica ATCC 64428]|uniref:Uncharacterized protein n=1 Tax=Fistulina hepatica ATCC 64428 TaxID=1128425 RepID=A0A0D7AHG3_9AGAR|nr:hypothetical protein FISHEDRAFT_71642 [Fistulina hepatica ATCC 64428]